MSNNLDAEYIAPETEEELNEYGLQPSDIIIVTGFTTKGIVYPVRCDNCLFDFAATINPQSEDFKHCLRCGAEFLTVVDDINGDEDESDEDSEGETA